jgi:uncharacterized protein YegJ (DUF2314 family)
MKLIFTICLLIIVTSGCNEKSSQTNQGDSVIKVADGDAEMNAAISNAKATLTSFITTLHAPQSNQNYFLIKGKFASGDSYEHIWVADISFDGSNFCGVVANEPEKSSGLSFKQKVEVATTNVTDWMYVQDGKLVGGFTSRVLRSRMTEKERQDEDSSIPYRFQ